MDLCLQAPPLLSGRHSYRRLLAGQTRLSSPQLGILARKLDHHVAFVRCSVARDGKETVDDKKGSKSATLEAANDVDLESWLELKATSDPFFGWDSGSQHTKASIAAGWMTIGGVLVLTLGFALGAHNLYSKRDGAREFMVGPPAKEESLHSFSKTTGVEHTKYNADPIENTEVSDRNGEVSEEAKQQHGENEVLEEQAEEHDSQLSFPVQETGPENHLLEEPGTNDDPISVSTLDKLEDTDELPKSLGNEYQHPPEHTFVMDAAAATERELSPEVAQSAAEVTDKDVTPSFTYVDGEDITAVLDESDVSDRFLSQEPTLDELLVSGDGLYEGSQKTTSGFEDDKHLTMEGNYAKGGSQKDIPHFKLRGGFLPAVITAPSTPLESLAISLGEVLVPAHVNDMQERVLATLQSLKVIEADVKAGDICTRREYARWLMCASALLTRSAAHKVLPAMYIKNVSVLAYEDVTPEDQDFPYIQGLAEAGLLSSKLVEEDHPDDVVKEGSPSIFSPDKHLTRQDLVTWKVALERKPAVMEGVPCGPESTVFEDHLGFIDLDKIHKDALPALLMDMSAGEQSIVNLAFGHTRRLQPQKLVTKGQAAVALATGDAWEFVSEELARLEAESVAEAAVGEELALEAKAQEEVAVAFEKLVQTERQKQEATASMIESLRAELEQMMTDRENEKLSLLKDRGVIEAERDLLHKARLELEQQALALTVAKVEAAFHQEKAEKLLREAEQDRSLINNIRSELEIEKNALILARSRAEDEARKAQEHLGVVEQTRKRWEGQATQVKTEEGVNAIPEKVKSFIPSSQRTDQAPVPDLDDVSSKGESQDHNSLTDAVLDKGKKAGQMVMDAFVRFFHFLELILHIIMRRAIDLYGKASEKFHEARISSADRTAKTVEGLKQFVPSSVSSLSSSVREGTVKMVDEWKGGAERMSQKFRAS